MEFANTAICKVKPTQITLYLATKDTIKRT